ncbi:HPr family phosphocarrier protein [bacterium]|jgi:phosphocarrier protein|nr:HPr family phosphocarrier protein [bacterium]
MKEAELTIKNKLGLHARAASLFVKTAEKFKCGVEMEKNGVRVNAKSIMGILMLAAPLGSTVKISTNGESEEECLSALTQLVETKFGEE